jgi:uncharacterized protein (TIGR03067 family)
MNRSTALAILVFAGLTASAQTQPPAVVPKPLIPLQGTWVMLTPDGQPVAPNGEVTIVVTGDKYVQSENGAITERGTIKLDATKKPMWVDILITEGDDAGKTQVGLIEVTGDTVTGALKPPGDSVRPTTLTPQDGVITFVAKKKVK